MLSNGTFFVCSIVERGLVSRTIESFLVILVVFVLRRRTNTAIAVPVIKITIVLTVPPIVADRTFDENVEGVVSTG